MTTWEFGELPFPKELPLCHRMPASGEKLGLFGVIYLFGRSHPSHLGVSCFEGTLLFRGFKREPQKNPTIGGPTLKATKKTYKEPHHWGSDS